MKMNKGFIAAIAQKRINPGDNEHTISKIVKITSGSNPQATKLVDKYAELMVKGWHIFGK